MNDYEKLKNMSIHDEMQIYNCTIIRVHGGWIYKTYENFENNGYTNYIISSVFVPG